MPYLETKNCSLYFCKEGTQGPWVTLINGYSRSSRDFRLFSKRLTSIGFRTLCFDNRGCGRTKSSAPFAVQYIVADTIALWDYLKIKSSSLIGISMGGVLTQLLCLASPQVVKKVVLISSTSQKEYLTSLENDPWPQDFTKARQRLEHYFSSRFILKNSYLIDLLTKNMLKDSNVFSGMLQQRDAMLSFDWQSLDSAKILAETLILHGNQDVIIPKEAAFKLNQELKNSTVQIFKECGHLLLAESPIEVFALVKNFLQ